MEEETVEDIIKKIKPKFYETSTFWFILYAVVISLFFLLFVLPVSIMNSADEKLEYYVAQEIDTDIPEELRDYDEVVFELEEIKEQRKVLDDGADWKIYNVKFRCVNEDSRVVVVKDYVAFVYYKFVIGSYFEKGYYAILDCDLVAVV